MDTPFLPDNYGMGTNPTLVSSLGYSGNGELEVFRGSQYGGTTFNATTPILDQDNRLPSPPRVLEGVAEEANLRTLHEKGTPHSHVATPKEFDRSHQVDKTFRRQVGLYITANEEDFTSEKKMILFALSYMTEGRAGKWAGAYVDEAIITDSWGTWQNFLEKLDHDFRDPEAPRRAMEEMTKLQQGKGMAQDYFLQYKQLANEACIGIHSNGYVLLQVKRGVNTQIMDQLYASANLPTTYLKMKQRVITLDEMWQRRQKKNAEERPTDFEPMQVDRQKTTTNKQRCFNCGAVDHLIRNCPKERARRDF
jgi:hypothetical protein